MIRYDEYMKKKKHTKAKMGRPIVPLLRKKNVQVSVAMTEAEFKRLNGEAKTASLSISELLMRPWRKGE